MKLTDKNIICELNILKNRLESGESVIQCLQSMGVPLRGHEEFLSQWKKLSKLMLEGRILPAKGVSEFSKQLECKNKLLQLAQQKTMSARIQAYLSTGIVFFLIASSLVFFPAALKPSAGVLTVSLVLCVASIYCMQLLLKNFEKELCFLNWISYLRSLALSLECGMTLPHALKENKPSTDITQHWPAKLIEKTTPQYIEKNVRAQAIREKSELWTLAHRAWDTLCRNYNEGLPQVALLQKLSELQEDEFKNWLTLKSEKLGYMLLIPLFTLSVPAILIILFAPLLSAIGA